MEKLVIIVICLASACLSNRNTVSSDEAGVQTQVLDSSVALNDGNTDGISDTSFSGSTTAASGRQSSANDSYNPFGVLISAGEGNNRSHKVRLQAYKELNPPYVRHGIVMSTWNGSNLLYESLQNAGYKIVLNVAYLPQGGGPMPFPTNLQEYKRKLNDILNTYTPEVLVVENEEYNKNYHTGSMQQYINELTAAIEVAHAKGIKVTNGGLTSRHLCLMVWKDYIDRGLRNQADNFAKRTLPTEIYDDLPGLARHKILAQAMNSFDTLLNAYQKLNMDYVNFHWYEPIIMRFNRNKAALRIDTNRVNTKALGEVVDFLRRKTGKEVMTNEIGQVTMSPAAVVDVLRKCYELKLPYVIWYSGDGAGNDDAKALTNYDGSLRENGRAFRDFVRQYK